MDRNRLLSIGSVWLNEKKQQIMFGQEIKLIIFSSTETLVQVFPSSNIKSVEKNIWLMFWVKHKVNCWSKSLKIWNLMPILEMLNKLIYNDTIPVNKNYPDSVIYVHV